MGIKFAKLEELRQRGILRPGCSVLDIGSSNLYSAEPEPLRQFIAAFNRPVDESFVARISAGSAYGPNGGLNESFVGELLEHVGITYLAFDIANGYRTRIFDLNTQTLPDEDKGRFDLVINFGTTEHVINQLNSLAVIHDATKVGGHIVHELPTVGYVDHGYFCYTPRLFFDLAGQNEYELVDFRYQGPAGGKDIVSIVRDYKNHFPALTTASKTPPHTPDDISSFIVLKKTKDAPLYLSLETSTSVFSSHQSSEIPAIAVHAMPFDRLTRYWLSRLSAGISRRLAAVVRVRS